MINRRIWIAVGVLLFAATACRFGASTDVEKREADEGLQLTVTAQALELELLAAESTAQAQHANETAQAVEEAAQETEEIEGTEDVPRVEEEPEGVLEEEQVTSESDPELAAFEQLVNDELQLLMEEQVISSVEGNIIPFMDWSEEVAKINYVTWWASEYAPESFVIRASSEWESASDTANWFNSGCGFVFGQEDEGNFYLIHLGLDGFVYLKSWVDGKSEILIKEKFGTVDIPDGSADVLLSVEGKNVAYFINGRKVIDTTVNQLDPGTLSFTVLSGTNRGFGTRCSLTDIGLVLFE